jgi:murein L,D-transpeptidase YafK
MFIPVGYPTAEQAKKGYSGGAIGVHGPVRGFTWAGALNTWVDWTRGCIAVATDEDIRKVSLWVEERKPKLIHILKGE